MYFPIKFEGLCLKREPTGPNEYNRTAHDVS